LTRIICFVFCGILFICCVKRRISKIGILWCDWEIWGRYLDWKESLSQCIPNNMPCIVGSARSIITSASLLRRAVRPSTCKSEFAYLTDREDRFCRKGVGIRRCTVPHTVRRRPFNFFSLFSQTGNENTVSRWRGTCVCTHLGGWQLNGHCKNGVQ